MQQFPLKSVEDYKMIMAHTLQREAHIALIFRPPTEKIRREKERITLWNWHII